MTDIRKSIIVIILRLLRRLLYISLLLLYLFVFVFRYAYLLDLSIDQAGSCGWLVIVLALSDFIKHKCTST